MTSSIFELKRLAECGELCMADIDVEKLKRRKGAIRCEVDVAGELQVRKMAPVWYVDTLYMADVYTGSLYDKSGACMTSERLTLLRVGVEEVCTQ